jgi:hypothetical protein
MWVGRTVKANSAFRAGEMDAAAIKNVVADTGKILE